jgi:phosphoribosylformylglycinamidine cyclo-ligase
MNEDRASNRSATGPALTYRRAGVDIAAADALMGRLRALAGATHDTNVRPYSDAYAGLYALPAGGLLAATCDGVGTKLMIAQALKSYRGLGQDLVAMNVNDLLPCGARPLFFLDYLAAGRLDGEVLSELVAGMASACLAVSCALLGGETAEMPGVYGPTDFDLAGFAVGLTDAQRLPKKERLQAGDVIVALPSTGIHANGFSLVRQALQRGNLSLHDAPQALGQAIGEALLTPTALYVKPVLAAFDDQALLDELRVAAHITGGGLLGRTQALAPLGLRLVIDAQRYTRPPIFDVIAEAGAITAPEMARTFNMGLGFVMIVSQRGAARLMQTPDSPWLTVGEVVSGTTGVELGYARSEAR